MASNRNDDMDRNKMSNPQASSDRNSNKGLTPSPTSPGNTREPMAQTGRDAVNKDREMNRDTELGQDSSGSGQSGRDSFGSTPSRDNFNTTDRSRGTSESDRNRTTGSDMSRDRDRGPGDISE